MLGEEPVCLPQPRAVDRVADAAAVREARPLDAPLEVGAERLLGARAEDVVLLLEHQVRDRHQLVDVVVGEVDVVGDPRAETGVRAEEVVHPVLVAGEDHDQLVALGLHHLEQDLDRLLPVVALVLGPEEVVGLVDEEHAAVGAAEHLLGLRRGVADVLADEVVAGAGDDPRLVDVAEPVQDLGHLHRHGRLARARVAGERHVQRRAARRRARPRCAAGRSGAAPRSRGSAS